MPDGFSRLQHVRAPFQPISNELARLKAPGAFSKRDSDFRRSGERVREIIRSKRPQSRPENSSDSVGDDEMVPRHSDRTRHEAIELAKHHDETGRPEPSGSRGLEARSSTWASRSGVSLMRGPKRTSNLRPPNGRSGSRCCRPARPPRKAASKHVVREEDRPASQGATPQSARSRRGAVRRKLEIDHHEQAPWRRKARSRARYRQIAC